MEPEESKPQEKPSGDRSPPRPPRAGIGLYSDGDGSGKKRKAAITKAAEGEGKFIRHSGCRDHYGHVKLAIEPRKSGAGIEICNISCNNVPPKFINPVVNAIEETLESGIGNYAPIVDLTVRIVDGSSHQTDSNELAFKLAAIAAVNDALKKADLIPIE